MSDFATLGLRVDGNGAITTVKQFGDASEKAGQQTAALEASVKKVATSTIASTRGMSALAAVEAEAAAKVGEHSFAYGRLERALGAAVGEFAGLNRILEIVGISLGKFTFGTIELVAGLAAIGIVIAVYQHFTEDMRKAADASDKLTASLVKQRKELLDATVAGQTAILASADKRVADAKKAVDDLNSSGFAFQHLHTKIEGELTDALTAQRQAYINLQSARSDEAKAGWEAANRSYELEKSLAADRKSWADQATKADNEALARLHKRIVALNELNKLDVRGIELAVDQRLKGLAPNLHIIPEPQSGLDKDTADAAVKLATDTWNRIRAVQKKAAEETQHIVKNLIRQVQTDFADFFAKIFSGGVASFRDQFNQVRQMFTKLVADVLAAKLIEKIRPQLESIFGGIVGGPSAQNVVAGNIMQTASLNMLTAANIMAGTSVAGNTTGAAAGLGTLGKIGAGVGIAFAGYGVGSSLGSAVGSARGGALAGAAGGALTGAAIGSIIPGFGTAVGAVIGGLAGLAGGFLSGAKAAKDFAAALAESRRTIVSSAASFHARATGTENSVEEQIRKIHEEAATLRRAIEAAFSTDTAAGRYARDLYTRQVNEDEIAYVARVRETAAIQATTSALNALTTSLRNAPSGFKVESYVNQYAAARITPGLRRPESVPWSQGGATSTGDARRIAPVIINNPVFTISGGTGEALFNDFMQTLRKKQATTTGINSALSETLDWA